MPSYHVVNGRPNHLSQHLAVLREGNPDLVVISDGFAPSDLIEKSRYYLDREHAYPAAMRAGLDSFTDHLDDPTITLRALHQAVELGLLSEPEIDAAVGRLLLMRVRLGEFDPLRPAVPDTIDSPEHRALAREAARQSLVLLQNDGVLPLRAGADRTVAVIGPLADRVCRDWYSGPLPYRVTPLDGIREQAGGRVSFTPGLDRISLLLPEDGRCLAVAGTGLTVADAPHGDEAVFEVFDWGEGGVALRSLATGLFLSRGRGDTLRCDQEELRGWEVQQTFCLVPEGDTWLLQNLFRGRYAAVEGTSVALGAADAAEATRFRVETVSLGTESAAEAARNAGSAVVVVGTHPQINGGEGRDRKELGLPGAQHRLVEAVLAANPRTVVVLVSGHPLAVPELADRAPAVLWSSHGGQEFGHGLADVLFGKRSPAGRLPQTWPRSLDDLADLRDYDIIKNRQTYLYSDRDPLYPFGHGLGYSSFRYSKPLLSSAEATPQDTVTITFEVTNTGTVDSDEVPQLYACSSESAPTRPLRRLHGFRRIRIPAGATRRLAFPLPIRDLAFWDVGRQTFTVAPGDYEVMVGPSSARTAHTAVLTVEAPPLPPRDLSAALTRAVDFDDYESVRIIDEARLSGEAVAAERDGAWLLYRDVLLGPDTDRAVFRLGASADRPSGLVQIRVDDPTQGQLLGSVGVPSAAAGRYTWQTVTTPLAPAPGRHDVYLVLTGQTRVATFMLTESTRSAQGGRA
jgi:beta-glucosidase